MTTPDTEHTPTNERETERDTDQLYQIAEKLAADFSLFPEQDDSIYKHVQGLVPDEECSRQLEELRSLDIDGYIERAVTPSESNTRMSSP